MTACDEVVGAAPDTRALVADSASVASSASSRRAAPYKPQAATSAIRTAAGESTARH